MKIFALFKNINFKSFLYKLLITLIIIILYLIFSIDIVNAEDYNEDSPNSPVNRRRMILLVAVICLIIFGAVECPK